MYNIELRGIRRKISSLIDENHQQNMEIALFKQKVGFQDKLDHRKVKKEKPNDQTINQMSTRTVNDRQKRPFRLLPPYSDELDAANLTELAVLRPSDRLLRSILIGLHSEWFYQVKSNESTNIIGINNDTKLDTVFGAFEQSGGTSHPPSLVEKRIIL